MTPGAGPAPAYPLAALVGQDEMVTALVLAALDPALGGVLLRGEKGSGKTTAARGLAALLADGAPFVELPLGATEDRVVGSLDLQAALGGGEYRFAPGLLAAAHGGVLYVDEVNLLADHLVDALLDAAATGYNQVERDGASHRHPARFVLIGSMNPEEGELRPQLLDRFGLSVDVAAPADPAERAEAVRRRLAFDADPVGFCSRWEGATADLRRRLAATRPVPLAPGLDQRIARLCAASGAEGLRADLVICRAAAALAGWEQRPEAGEDEVRRVAPMALGHRRRAPWEPSQAAGELDRLLEETSAPVPPEPGPVPEGPGGRVDGRSGPDGGTEPAPDRGDGGGGGDAPEPAPAPRPPVLSGPAETAPGLGGPPGAGVRGEARWRSRGPSGPAGGEGPGRVVGAAPLGTATGGRGLAATATVVAATGRLALAGDLRPGTPLELAPADLRQAVVARPAGGLVVLAVDASGSMGVAHRLAAVADAARALLVQAYQRRDRVAVVSFRGTAAEVVLRPTASIEVAARRLEQMASGGRTPLAAGLEASLSLVRSASAEGSRPLVVLLSDGRATWAPDGEDPVAAARRAAGRLRRAGVASVVVDLEEGPVRLGLAGPLARTMGARYVRVDELSAADLVQVVHHELDRPPVPPPVIP